MWHLHEVVVSNSRVWLKVQASGESVEQAAAFFEARFNGTDYVTADGHQPVTPFSLSERSHYIANWGAIEDRLPAGWEDEQFQIEGSPYPWCETLSDDCDCHGSKGRLDEAFCSDFGSHDEADRRARKTENVRHQHDIRRMEETIVGRDESRRAERAEGGRPSPPPGRVLVAAKPNEHRGEEMGVAGLPAGVLEGVNQLVAGGLYCSVHGRRHAYGEQAIRNTMASLAETYTQISTWGEADRVLAMSKMRDISAHWLQMHQSEECAQRSVWVDVDIPDILYKYIPRELIGKGAPDSLRATQLLALNDDMECNVTTMKGSEQEDTLKFLALVQSKLEGYLGVAVPWEELLTRSLRYGDLRLSTFIQEYLNPLVGVVSFSSDILVPTMWAHYARNTGIVVGYDTEALAGLGFELRPVIYSELAPTYEPVRGNDIRLDFVNRAHMESELRAGRDSEGLRILTSTDLATFGAGWKLLSRVLLVKGMSWSYEKEVRLLVDLAHTRDVGKEDANGWRIKVIDPPPDAIREIYGGANTRKADVDRAVQAARGDKKNGLFVGHVSSHAFRIQKTGGVRY